MRPSFLLTIIFALLYARIATLTLDWTLIAIGAVAVVAMGIASLVGQLLMWRATAPSRKKRFEEANAKLPPEQRYKGYWASVLSWP